MDPERRANRGPLGCGGDPATCQKDETRPWQSPLAWRAAAESDE
ncbi:hypothetical protein CORC01_08682 [Colletotrichum orchidophilum]|uniref:Uncharacterized protein n=1 Tax=Colletotrichum orchidophilum TaxID=1209926 RepID=A0A1G4B3I8_9PEZI|nr:uncharacterized protein CORC01_08682 [Colletotrichum orchidophilum]OHE95989.1 hypothetical protein CORC01_08682 [Colletotrichum orchidophilum]